MRAFVFVLLLAVGSALLPLHQASEARPAKVKNAAAKSVTPPKSFYSGMAEFQAQRYGPAAAFFEQADLSGYCNDKTHYYIALCYHNLNQTQRAIEHYSWVATYSKDPTLKYKAQLGYAQVAKYASHRTYSGNGNNFTAFSGSGGRRG